MLGLYEYNALPEVDKANICWNEGTYLTLRTEGQYKINLYSLYNFFVEMWYDPVENKITKLRTFSSRHQLGDYLDNLDIEKLINGAAE